MPTPALVPLPVEPAPPFIETQAATSVGSGDLDAPVRWRYRLDYRHEHVAQDEVAVTIAFNVPPDADAVAADTAPPRVDYRYRARLIFDIGGEFIEALELTSEQPESGPGGRWPQAHYRDAAGADIALGDAAGEGDRRRYAFDPPQCYEGWPRIGLSWSELVLSDLQNAQASLAAVRNAYLDEPVADDAIFRTPTVTAASVSPDLRWSDDVPIDALGEGVDTALDALFARWFGARRDDQRISLQMAFEFHVGTADTALSPKTSIPVGLVADQRFGRETASAVAEALAAWLSTQPPFARGAQWRFGLTVYSQLDTRVPRPLLDVPGIVRHV